jgi:hypothetical protein
VTDAWLRFAGILIANAVVLAGVILTFIIQLRQLRQHGAVPEELVKEMRDGLAEVNKTMMIHLRDHSAEKGVFRW